MPRDEVSLFPGRRIRPEAHCCSCFEGLGISVRRLNRFQSGCGCKFSVGMSRAITGSVTEVTARAGTRIGLFRATDCVTRYRTLREFRMCVTFSVRSMRIKDSDETNVLLSGCCIEKRNALQPFDTNCAVHTLVYQSMDALLADH